VEQKKTACDGCGKLVPNNELLETQIRAEINGKSCQANHEICADCAYEITKWMSENNKHARVEE